MQLCEKLVHSNLNPTKSLEKTWQRSLRIQQKSIGMVPTIVGASVLELAKFHMYKFNYDIMKPNFECQLLYSDTDSLLYREISEKRNILNELDLSNYPKNHTLYDPRNKMVVLKFMDEFPGDIITEFISLKPKLYSILSRDN